QSFQVALKGEDALAIQIVSDLKAFNSLQSLLDAANAVEHWYVLISECLAHAATEPSAGSVFTPQIIIDDWKELSQWLNDNQVVPFRELLGRLVKDTPLCAALMERTDGFTTSEFTLYQQIVRAESDGDVAFKEWCCHGLERFEESDWTNDFASSFDAS